MTESRRPLHLGAFIGLSAGAYALSLALVTALQAEADGAVLADRVPTAEGIASLASQNDSLEADAERAARRFRTATDDYGRLSLTFGEVEAQLAQLAETVSAVDGAARALPDHVALPTIRRVATRASAPTVHATTAASGG